MTNGCLAVNVIGNHDITCELTTGLSRESELQDVYNSDLFVLGELKRLSTGEESMDKINLTSNLLSNSYRQLIFDN